MADLTITAANVGFTAEATVQFQKVTYGETVTQGQPLYLNTADNEYYKADANASSTTAAAAGIAILPGGDGEYGIIATSGYIDLGATLAVGQTYCVSATAGGIAPLADLTTGDYPCILGIAETTGKLKINIQTSSAAKP